MRVWAFGDPICGVSELWRGVRRGDVEEGWLGRKIEEAESVRCEMPSK